MGKSSKASSRRRNIQDIAAAAGVSAASVSYALNGKPGVSEATRERILAVAREYNWEPNRLAQALHSSRTDIVGFVIPVTNQALSEESFWIQFISGLEHALRLHGRSLLLHTEERVDVEMEIYRTWRRRDVVDAVVLTDLRADDARVPFLQEIGLPTVLAGKPDPDLGMSYCYASDTEDMHRLLSHLHGMGLRRFARLEGDPTYLFVRERGVAAAQFASAHGLPEVTTVAAGFTSEASLGRAIDELLAADPRPEVIIADSDLLAVRTLQGLVARGLSVPDDIQIVAFDDSVTCRLVSPAITAMNRRSRALGTAAGQLVVDVPDTQRILAIQPAEFHPRASTRTIGY